MGLVRKREKRRSNVASGFGPPLELQPRCEQAREAGLSFSDVVRLGMPAWCAEGVYRYRFESEDGAVWFAGAVDCPGTHPWRLHDPRAPGSIKGVETSARVLVLVLLTRGTSRTGVRGRPGG